MRALLALALLATVALPGCHRVPPAPTGQVVAERPSGDVQGGVRVVRLRAFRYGYDPSRVVVRQGERVRILAETSDTTHTWTIRELGIDGRIGPGHVTTIELTAGRPGQYTAHCTVYCGPGHREMAGTLVVQ